ncbi:MAG: hypothetical protein IT445_05085 [Phycisphaeraceae bacterium]|nr:hypothetical protein [Phycisphaeraceae bacterium]
MPRDGVILFTAFEPSGDALAAALIARLIRDGCTRPIFALGGAKMQAAGATLIENTTQKAVMLAGAVAQAMEHRRRVQRLAAWLNDHPVALHVPTDSPAANWVICKLVRRQSAQAKIVHLAAPQLWAWAPWRIGKLRRLTDLVLCLLPFEPDWFQQRGVQAQFVGHPLYDECRIPNVECRIDPAGLALLPGSRSSEIARNWPTMREALNMLDQPVRANIAAVDDMRAEQIKQLGHADIPIFVGQTDRLLAGARAALVVSGTATLQCARHHVPMVSLFNVVRWQWQLAGRWLVRTRTFTLPNLIGEALGIERVIPELVPHFGDPRPVAEAVQSVLHDEAERRRQMDAFARFDDLFGSARFCETAAAALRRMLEGQD